MRNAMLRAAALAGLSAASMVVTAAAAEDLQLGLPAACTVGKDCFVQQFADIDPGPAAVDSFCGTATYEGHDGIDLRVLSLVDVARGVPVLAMADGVVVGTRDETPDRLVASKAEADAISKMGCGNLAVIQHADGYRSRYCHMRHGSVAVKKGDLIKRGQQIGLIGASGLAEFPHVEVALTKDDVKLDPMTGRPLEAGCNKDGAARSLFAPDIAASLGKGEAQVLALGVAGDVIDYRQLTQLGPPPAARSTSRNFVGWGWLINLRKGDRVGLKLTDAAGKVLAEQTSEPMDHSKATWSLYSGKRGSPAPGNYDVELKVLRDGTTAVEKRQSFKVE